jgi:uncharacterized membrane protein YbhN (UPF0104 family)
MLRSTGPLVNRKLLSNLLSAILGLVLIWYVWLRWDDLAQVWEEPSWKLLLIGVLIVAAHFLNSLEFWIVYRAMNLKISIFENWMVFTSGLLGNLVSGQVGTLYKFRYMKTVHGLAYSSNGSSYGANLVISLGSSSIVGLVGIFFVFATGGSFSFVMAAVFLGLGVLCFVLMKMSIPKRFIGSGKLSRAAEMFGTGWDEIRRTPKTSLQVVLVDVLKYSLTAWRFLLVFELLGYDNSFWFYLVIAPAAAIAGIIAFTPGGLGFRELFVTSATVGMGGGLDTGLLAATTDRGVMLISALVLGVSGFYFTQRQIKSHSEKSA